MSRRVGELPRRLQLEILAYLCASGESTIREFLTAKGLSEAKLPFQTISNDLRALEQRDLVESTSAGQGKPAVFQAKISRVEFQDMVCRFIADAAFAGDVDALAAAAKRLAKSEGNR